MNSRARAPAHRLVAAFGVIVSALGCGDGDPSSGDAGTGGAAATGGSPADGGETTTGGTTGRGGTTTGGENGGGDAGSEADCSEDDDCVPLGECYSAACRAGTCVGSARERGSACSDGFCNGFARCLPCLDDAPSGREDSGCSEDAPVCAETASEPECVECHQDSECDDAVECTLDRCAESACDNAPQSFGSACSGGFCNGEAGEDSCAACFDDANAGVDTGCTLEQPRCDTTTTPAACSGCQTSSDCDDDNECTADSCHQAACERATLPSGTPCTFGYCNGIRGGEVCIPKPCQTDVDCDDRVGCTSDVCERGSCAYTTNHAACADSGDICRPNLCSVGTGCHEVDVTRALELLANGALDAGNQGWLETSASYTQVIYEYDYVPTLQPHTGIFIAWLGGGEGLIDDVNSLSQMVSVPARTVRLDLSFFYQIWTQEGLPDDHNHMQVELHGTQSTPNEEDIVTFHNQDQTRVWTRFSMTIDAADWAGSDVILEFSGSAIGGFTHFFVDSISLVATVCE